MSSDKESWLIYEGTNKQDDKKIKKLPKSPPWREKKEKKQRSTYKASKKEIELVNTALYLRRPLLVTGKPGVGKSSLAHSVACELGLGDVLHWQITTKTTLEDGLYSYDAIGRLQDNSLNQKRTFFSKPVPDIGEYITLGALGMAFASKSMRVLLIDEIDKSDIDLPNNLLHILEENKFKIPELVRLKEGSHFVNCHESDEKIRVNNKVIECQEFPLIIMTSNGEREFPPAFLRRCLHLEIEEPDEVKLKNIVESHLDLDSGQKKIVDEIIKKFIREKEDGKELATDQLLNAIFLKLKTDDELVKLIWHSLSS